MKISQGARKKIPVYFKALYICHFWYRKKFLKIGNKRNYLTNQAA